MEFAADYWNRVCKSDNHDAALGLDSARDVPLSAVWDQHKAPAASYEPRFLYNPATDRDDLVAVPKPGATARSASPLKPIVILDGKQLEDCAHFLSQCLKAGGLRIAEQWSVPMLLNTLRSGEDHHPTPIAKTLAEKVPRAAAQAIIDAGLLKIGDMIGYFADGHYTHSAMYTGVRDGVGRVTCHTKSRFMGWTPSQVPDAWYLANPRYTFTLLHIPYSHPPPLGATLAGWWRVTSPLRTEYYYVLPDGRAMRTTNVPKTTKAPHAPGPGDSRGYWFSDLREAKFCWRLDGCVVKMTPDRDGTSARVLVDRVGTGTATKLRAREI
jgi:putative amidase-like protein